MRRREKYQRKRAQVSFEYLFLLAFVMALILPGVFFLYQHSKRTNARSAGAEYRLFGEQLLSSAQKVLSLGSGSWLTFKGTLPSSVRAMNITGGGKEVVIMYETPFGESEAVFFSDVPLENKTGSDGTLFSGEPHDGKITLRLSLDEKGIVRIEERSS